MRFLILAALILAAPAMADEYALMSSTGAAVVLWVVTVAPQSVGALPPGIWVKTPAPSTVYQGQKYDGSNFVVEGSTPAAIQPGVVGTP